MWRARALGFGLPRRDPGAPMADGRPLRRSSGSPQLQLLRPSRAPASSDSLSASEFCRRLARESAAAPRCSPRLHAVRVTYARHRQASPACARTAASATTTVCRVPGGGHASLDHISPPGRVSGAQFSSYDLLRGSFGSRGGAPTASKPQPPQRTLVARHRTTEEDKWPARSHQRRHLPKPVASPRGLRR